MSAPGSILVTGATGNQGGAVINALIAPGQASSTKIYALTRNPESESAKALASKATNVQLVKGDLDDSEAVFKEIGQPVDAVLLVPALAKAKGAEVAEERQGKQLISAAAQHGVKHIVFTSVDRHGAQSDTDPTYVPQFASKHQVELHLKKTAAEQGFSWTILRPVAFMDNMQSGMFLKMFDTWWGQLGPKKLQLVSVKDIGIFGAKALLNPEQYKNRAISLAGDELTKAEGDQIYRKLYGKPLPTTFEVVVNLASWWLTDLGMMWKYFGEIGYAADVEECRKINPEMQTLEEWLKENHSP